MGKDEVNKIIKQKINSTIGNIGNGVLYDLCQKYPLHDNPDVINAKIWLIGRAYAAAIERRKKYLNDLNDDFYEKRVIPMIMKSSIDQRIDKIREYKSITKENILNILKVHKFLSDLFCDISGLKKRSLASKYLHFHFPDLFFIYDSRAKNALSKISDKLSLEYKKIIDSKKVDKKYATFFCKSYEKKNEFEDIQPDISTRQFDSILIVIANQELRK